MSYKRAESFGAGKSEGHKEGDSGCPRSSRGTFIHQTTNGLGDGAETFAVLRGNRARLKKYVS